jgi:predicted amidohydrolase
VRAHEASGGRVVVDFRFERQFEQIAASLTQVAAAHPNAAWTELTWADHDGQAFPVRPREPGRQHEQVLSLTQDALARGAGVVVFPELSVPEETVGALAELVYEHDEPALVVAGSHHTTAGGEPANVAVGLLAGRREHLVQHKNVPFSEELGAGAPTKEGIPLRQPPGLTVHQADRFRVAVLVCRDALDEHVTSALDRMGVNLLLAPAFSAKSAPFVRGAHERVQRAQALTFVVNGPLCGGDGRPIVPSLALIQPVEGWGAVEATVADVGVRSIAVPTQPGDH